MRINGPAVKALRVRDGHSITRLAELAGIDRTNLTRIESGNRRGTEAQAAAIAAALKVPVIAIIQTTEAVA